MGVNYTIRSVADTKDIRRLKDFVLGQRLWYPAYEDWVERAIAEVESGYKQAVIAYSYGHVVGDIIYQAHKELPGTREFKNMRIHHKSRRRDLGHFLLRQAEEEDKGTFNRIILDLDARLTGVIEFLEFCGYRELYRAQIYCSDNIDVVMVKELTSTPLAQPLLA